MFQGRKESAIMRIEAYNQVAQLYKTNKTSSTRPASASAMGRDEVQISSFGRDYQIAKKAVAEASDIREDKVAEMKSKYESNDYQVDTGDFASKLLEKYQPRHKRQCQQSGRTIYFHQFSNQYQADSRYVETESK